MTSHQYSPGSDDAPLFAMVRRLSISVMNEALNRDRIDGIVPLIPVVADHIGKGLASDGEWLHTLVSQSAGDIDEVAMQELELWADVLRQVRTRGRSEASAIELLQSRGIAEAPAILAVNIASGPPVMNGGASSPEPSSHKRSFTMIDNTQLLKHLLANKLIHIRDAQILNQPPNPLPASCKYEKVEGMLLGVAIGDALGATSEGLNPSERRRLYGEIRHYMPDKRDRKNRRPAGVGTDDTQESFWTVEQLLDDRGLVPESLAHKFCKDRIWGPGAAIKEFIKNFKDRRLPWYQSGPNPNKTNANLGNGALMRIAPIVLPYLRNPHPSMYADAAIATMMTHNGFANTATCVAYVHMLWELLGMNSVPKPEWWADNYCSLVKELEGSTKYKHSSNIRGEYSGSLWNFVSQVCKEALNRGLTVEDACDAWGSSANLFETVPSVLHILATYADDPEEAIIRAVNDTQDNDSIASIVGAAVGALHGLGSIPERWVKNLNGSIRDGGGGGQVFRLIVHSKHVFWL